MSNENIPERLIIQRKQSLIPDIDVLDLRGFQEIVSRVKGIPSIKAVKVDPGLCLGGRMQEAVKTLHEANLKAIYDHQKLGADPSGKESNIIKKCRNAGFDAVIIFGLTRLEAVSSSIDCVRDQGMIPIVGSHMTTGNLESEGGLTADSAPKRVFELALKKGVRNFVVPGTIPWAVKEYVEMFAKEYGMGNFLVMAPGFGQQPGCIPSFKEVAGTRAHIIVGRDIYESNDQRTAAERYIHQLSNGIQPHLF